MCIGAESEYGLRTKALRDVVKFYNALIELEMVVAQAIAVWCRKELMFKCSTTNCDEVHRDVHPAKNVPIFSCLFRRK